MNEKVNSCYVSVNEDKEILIAGSVGPYGAFLTDGSEYTGNYISTCDIEYIKKWHRPRIQALIEGGVDVLAFETIPALQEAKVLIELLKEYPNMKAWLSFSCKVRPAAILKILCRGTQM